MLAAARVADAAEDSYGAASCGAGLSTEILAGDKWLRINTKPPPPQVMAREDELRAKYEGKRVIRTEDIAGYWLCCCCPVPCGIVHKEAIGPHQMRWRHRGLSPGVPCFCGRKLDYVVERTGGNDFGDDKTFAKTYATPFWIEDCLECWCKLGICRCRGTNCDCCEALKKPVVREIPGCFKCNAR